MIKKNALIILICIWGGLSLFLFLIIFILSLDTAINFEKEFSNKISSMFKWFLPTILPNLTIMFGVISKNNWSNFDKKEVEISIVVIAIILSFIYFFVVFYTFYYIIKMNRFDVFETSHFWITPFHSVISIVIGLFIIKEKKISI